jgi:hypothetical protein
MADFMERHTIVLDGSDRMDVDLTALRKSDGTAFRMQIEGDVVLFAERDYVFEKFIHSNTVSEN